MRTVDLRGVELDSASVNRLLPRASVSVSSLSEVVAPIIERVRKEGETALVDFAERFDSVDPRPIRVPQEELDVALESLDGELRAAIELAIERVRKVSSANLPLDTVTTLSEGAVVEQRWLPVEAVGLYVPGGKAVYPSSVVMNVVPAQVAGVKRLAMVTPPQRNFAGRPHPTVLATAALLGVTEVYAIGGPAAIAALAHGVPTLGLEAVSLITGPGNNYVTAAKRALRSLVGIDSEAGATEIMVIADSSADPRIIAADLISQAEHDESAASVLVTDSAELLQSVASAVAELAPVAHHAERVMSALSGQQSALVLVESMDSAILVANHYATEHLEIQTARDREVLAKISNAGAIFLGANSPVSLGDYMAGSNHVLPTSQQAKSSSGLGVHTFLRAQQVISYSGEALGEIAASIDTLAKAEGLPAHGAAVLARNHKM